MEVGIIGLGKIGGNLALQALEKNIRVVGKDISPKPDLAEKGVEIVNSWQELASSLSPPRILLLYLPAGQAIDKVLEDLLPYLARGDVVVDGGNSFFRDSIAREKKSWEKGIFFLDCGTSGGVPGSREGACFMVGGKEEGVKRAEPVLKRLAVDGGFLHTGPPGSGHFVKLVHNGIEFGILQSIGEGIALLEGGEFKLNLPEIFSNWSHGSVIRGWLVELMEKGLREKGLESTPSHVEDTGEVNWLVQEAIEKEIPIPVITQAIIELFKSRDSRNLSARAVSLLRHGFGGHPFGKDSYISEERKRSRITR